jgi:hypothetical protein
MLRGMVWVLPAFVFIAGLLVPVLIDAHHWWPRKHKKTDTQSPQNEKPEAKG